MRHRGPRLVRLIVAAFLVSGVPGLCEPSASATLPEEIRGAWYGGTITGARLPHQTQPRCVAFQWSDRSVVLKELPGHPTEFRGSIVEFLHNIWTYVGDADCRWAHEPAFLPSYDGLRTLSFEGHLESASGVLTATVHDVVCQGLACSELNPLPLAVGGPSNQTLVFRLKDGTLLQDRGSGEPVVFQRTSQFAAGLKSANEMANRIDRTFDSAFNNLPALYQLDLLFVDGTAPPVQSLAQVRQRIDRINERDLETATVGYGPRIGLGSSGSGRLAMILTHGVCANGVSLVELLVLQEEASGWKIAWLQFI